MIVAPGKRFIFIHVPKAAGTSINSALSLHDVFAPARKGDLAVRQRLAEEAGLPERLAQLGEHASARQLITVLGRGGYDAFHSFAFVRNPWDVAVSWFHYRLINPDVAGHKEAAAAGSFPVYVKRYLTGPEAERWVGLQHPFIVDDSGAPAVSFIGRYESLAADFTHLVATLGIQVLALDHFNQSYHPAWPQLYSRETFAIVHGLVMRDAQLFAYPQDSEAYGIV